jgi:hypothetical protein
MPHDPNAGWVFLVAAPFSPPYLAGNNPSMKGPAPIPVGSIPLLDTTVGAYNQGYVGPGIGFQARRRTRSSTR